MLLFHVSHGRVNCCSYEPQDSGQIILDRVSRSDQPRPSVAVGVLDRLSKHWNLSDVMHYVASFMSHLLGTGHRQYRATVSQHTPTWLLHNLQQAFGGAASMQLRVRKHCAAAMAAGTPGGGSSNGNGGRCRD